MIPQASTPQTERNLGEALEGFLPGALGRDDMPSWPPDIFAVAASLLQVSGAYLRIVESWPPDKDTFEDCLEVSAEDWAEEIHALGLEWRNNLQAPPDPLPSWWRILIQNRKMALRDIPQNPAVLCALAHLCAVADEASFGIGIWQPKGENRAAGPRFRSLAEGQLLPDRDRGSTVCIEVDPSRARVLPKFHSPQTGISVRSLSHHLALWTAHDVTPFWFTARPTPWWSPEIGFRQSHCLNLLLAPWPLVIAPNAFTPARPECGQLRNMPESFGFFQYRQKSDSLRTSLTLQALYESALQLTDRVHGIVLPEMALHHDEYEALGGWATDEECFLITGVHEPGQVKGSGDRPAQNFVMLEVPLSDEHYLEARQRKHHRWRLDRSQIFQYGLGGQLDPERIWWEHSETDARSLTFVSMLP